MSKKKPSPKEAAELRALTAMQTAFPIAFPTSDADIQPLAINTRDALLAWAETQAGFQVKHAKNALVSHCMRIKYKKKVIEGVMRIDLQGNPVEPVSAEGAAHAAEYVATWRTETQRAADAKAKKLARHQAMQEKQQKIAAAKKEAAAAAKAAAKTSGTTVKKSAPPRAPRAHKTAPPAALVAPAVPAVKPTVIIKKKRTIVIPS
jgi:sRNA-binding protein